MSKQRNVSIVPSSQLEHAVEEGRGRVTYICERIQYLRPAGPTNRAAAYHYSVAGKEVSYRDRRMKQ